MTVARFNARGKTRLLLFLGLTLAGLIFVILFHNNQQENDELRQLELRCQQQLGAIQAQKSRVENSLASEKLSHEKVLQELQDYRSRHQETAEKLKSENQKFSSLQQDCKLSQTALDDQRKECNQIKFKQIEEIDSLKEKIQKLKQQVDDLQKEKDKEVTQYKHKLEKLSMTDGDIGPEKIEKLRSRNFKLEQELTRYKEKCDKYGFQYETSSTTGNAVKSRPKSVVNFSEQIPVSPNVYRILNNSTSRSTNKYTSSLVIGGKQNNNKKHSSHETTLDNGIINSVENFQIAQQPIVDVNRNQDTNVLQQPQLGNKGSTTTTTESPKAVSSKSSVDSKWVAPPMLQAPTVKENKSTTAANTNNKKEKKIPEGVVPLPDWEQNIKEDNRYSNIIDENKGEIAVKNTDDLNFLNANEQENLANEVPDNDLNIDEKKVNPENGVGEDKINNNAEEDTNLYEYNKDVFNTNLKDNDILHGRRSGNVDSKLRNEVAGDHGKEGDHYPDEDLRIEGPNEEEGDVGDYDDPNVLKQGPGPAERNKK